MPKRLIALLVFGVLLVQPVQAQDAPYVATAFEPPLAQAINVLRAEHGVHALSVESVLTEASRAHSEDMIARRFFDHLNPEGQSPTDRAARAGFTCTRQRDGGAVDGIAENVYFRRVQSGWSERNGVRTYNWQTVEEAVAGVIEGWMNSPPHRANLLLESASQMGVGTALSPEGELLVTLKLC